MPLFFAHMPIKQADIFGSQRSPNRLILIYSDPQAQFTPFFNSAAYSAIENTCTI